MALTYDEYEIPHSIPPTITHHKSMTDHPVEDCEPPREIQTSRSYHNGNTGKSKKHNRKKKKTNLKKRKSEASIHIATSRLFPNSDNYKPSLNGYNHNKPRHSMHVQSRNGNGQRQMKTNIGYTKQNGRAYDDTYAPFDFNSYHQKLQQKSNSNSQISTTRRRAATTVHNPRESSNSSKGVQFNLSHSNTAPNHNSNRRFQSTNQRPKSVKFSAVNSKPSNNTLKANKNKGISFRKSHNNLPIMHPSEVEAIQNKKKKKKNFYKQRASYSAAHFSQNKHQLLTQRNFKKHSNNAQQTHGNGNGNNSGHRPTTIHIAKHAHKMHIEDEEFLNSLVQPVKKREMNDAINKLKQVIEHNNLKAMIGSNLEMSLREVLRKLQLLRLDVTLREYKGKGGMNEDSSHNMSTTTDDEKTDKELYTLSEEREQEQNRVLIAIKDKGRAKDKKEIPKKGIDIGIIEEKKEDSAIMTALLVGSQHRRNHFEINKSNGVLSKSTITLTRRRFTISAATPTDSDRAGIEVAQWLSTRYSTFGRYEIPPSPLSGPIKSNSSFPKHNTIKKIKPLRLSNNVSSVSTLSTNSHMSDNSSEDKIDLKRRRKNNTKLDINKFVKLVTSDMVLLTLKGIGTDWDWCIFDLYDICGDSILLVTAQYIFDTMNLFEKFSINRKKFQAFFSVIQRGYCHNPYHSALHGADVLINIFFWVNSSEEFKTYLSDLDIIIALISAACHDYMHPGLTQNFQISTNSDMALKYNGRSVLENMHCSETIRLLLKPEYSIFKSLKKSEFRYVRELITDMILGTDMQMHSDHVKKSNDLYTLILDHDITEKEKERHTKNILVIGLHVADIANPCKPWLDCKRWTYMLMEEWFRQGDKEKNMGLEVSPMMDRTKPNIPRGQVGFIDYIVKPLFVNWNKLFQITDICCAHLNQNKDNWTSLNTDPHANDVQWNLAQLTTNKKEFHLREPIAYSEEREEARISEGELHAVITTHKKTKKKKKKKKHKKKSKSTKTDTGKKVKDVPFTPEQAEALHVSYSDIVYAEKHEQNSGQNHSPPQSNGVEQSKSMD